MDTKRVRGIDLAFDTRGDGKELIAFIHGVGADKSAWLPQLDFFAGHGYTVVAIDMRGTGDSQARDAEGLALPISITEFALDVDALIAELGFKKAHWVGNSMGGVIVLEALDKRMAAVDRAVLCNTFAKHPNSRDILPRPGMALKSKSLHDFAAERIPLTLRADTPPDLLAASIDAMARKDVETYLASWRATWSPDYRVSLAAINAPVLVITGSEDKLTPPALGEEIAAGIPGAQLLCIEGAGHISNMDRPDEFNNALLAFLRD